MLLKDKVILVVGAGGLLGREIVRSVVQEGGRVIAADMNTELVAPLVDDLGQDQVLPCQIDITDKKSIDHVFAFADKSGLQVSGAVNTAYPRNKNYGRKALEVTYEDFCENVSLHLGGYFLFMQQAALFSQKNNVEFSLVNLSSIYGVIPPKFKVYGDTDMTMPVEYAAIKSALLHMNKYFSSLMKGSRFRVNSVSPGGINNNQQLKFINNYKAESRIKGMLDPSDIVGALNFLLSDGSKYVCGQNIIVDDSFSI